MTTKQLNRLAVGTRVQWVSGDLGTVAKDASYNHDAPHLFIRWDDGEITDGRDGHALLMVTPLTPRAE